MAHIAFAENIGSSIADSLTSLYYDLCPESDDPLSEALHKAQRNLYTALHNWSIDDGNEALCFEALGLRGKTDIWSLTNGPTKILQKAARYLMETYPDDRGYAIDIGMAAYQVRVATKKWYPWFLANKHTLSYGIIKDWPPYPGPIPTVAVPVPVPVPEPLPLPDIPTVFITNAIHTITSWPKPGLGPFNCIIQAIWSRSWPYPVTQRQVYDAILNHDWSHEVYGTRYILLLDPIVVLIERQPSDKKYALYTKLIETVIETMDQPHWKKVAALPEIVAEFIEAS
jgi:hypothetical protein